MRYTDLRDFIAALEKRGELKRIAIEIDPHLEMTEIADRTLRRGGARPGHESDARGRPGFRDGEPGPS